MISPELFVYKIISLDYDGVKEAINEGFDVNTRIPGKVPIIEAAQPSRDFEMLQILWKAGAVPTTPWLQELFAGFEKGIIPEKEKKELPINIKKLQSSNFSMKKLNVTDGKLQFADDEWRVILTIEPFELDGEFYETKIYMDYISIPTDSIKNLERRKFLFPEYPEEGYIDASIYLKNVHNPITVRTITFKKYNNRSNTIFAEFDLEFEFDVIDLENESFRLNALLTL